MTAQIISAALIGRRRERAAVLLALTEVVWNSHAIFNVLLSVGQKIISIGFIANFDFYFL
jgi:hypothetical protein